ncbi:DEAD/DEAH box helicase, partial [Kocuria oceani]
RSRDRFSRRNGGEGLRPGPETRRVSRPQLIRRLDAEGLLPVITFIFSRAGCDGAVQQCVAADIRLTTDKEQRTIRARVAETAASLEAADLNVLGFYEWRDGLLRGVAAHHAGMLPAFKELVEQLFADGLVKAVFATETLALGINMPARSVVLEKLDKFNGESRVDITPGEYTQLTGRAGRRGIDVEGHAVVLWQPGMDPRTVAGLASKRTYPLNSSFRPTYNMSVNLVAQFGAHRSRKILESSFAQFQADRSVVGLARRVRSQEESLRGYEEAMTCHLGDFTEYAALRRELKDLERAAERSDSRRRRSDAVASLHDLLPGDVVEIPRGRNAGYAVVLSTDPNRDDPRPSILTLDHQLRRVGAQDLDGPLEPVSRIRIPKHFTGKTPKERRDLASSVRNALHEHRPPRGGGRGHTVRFDRGTSAAEQRIVDVRKALRAHPCHGCSDRENHARWAERWWTLRRDTDGLLRQIEGRTNTIARTFDRVSQVLDSFGYLEALPDGEVRPTHAGEQLRRIYGDRDLLLALSLRDGFLDGLDPAATAGLVTLLVYQAKREDQRVQPVLPSAAMDRAAQTVVRNWSVLTDREQEHHLPPTAEPEFGLVEPMHLWARGATLSTALTGTELAAGDFVRWAKQVIDMLDQLASIDLLSPELRSQCQRAIALVRRGVVAHSAFED